MAPPVRVKIGDTIEFVASTASSSFTRGRVVDVNPAEPELCTVQLSPYEPLQIVNLSQCAHKVSLFCAVRGGAPWRVTVTDDLCDGFPSRLCMASATYRC